MASTTAKIFKHGRSQAVRLPKEFRLPGTECRVRREGNAVILEPMAFDVDEWFARIDALRGDEEFLAEGRPEQPPMPDDTIDWDRAFADGTGKEIPGTRKK